MFINFVKKYVIPSILLSQVILLTVFTTSQNISLDLRSKNYLISTLIYFLFSLLVINAYFYKPIISFVLFLSLFLLSKNNIENDGVYFPITILIFFSYVLLKIGEKIFYSWKKSL
jgi:hypothetical protein